MTTKASKCQVLGISTFNFKPVNGLQLRRISAPECYPLRQKVLRPSLPIKESMFDCDPRENTFHVGGFSENRLIGIATFFPEVCSLQSALKPYRLRGMAVDPDLQGRGVGQQILVFGEQELRLKNVDLLWFNARESAFLFYQSLRYQFASELFEIPGVGPHKVMFKKLTPS